MSLALTHLVQAKLLRCLNNVNMANGGSKNNNQ